MAEAKRFAFRSDLKPEKLQDYIDLHAEPWPELIELLQKCHIGNYSIALHGTEVFTYYEYDGEDFEADMAYLDSQPVMQRWWVYSKPCFLHHDKGHYYDDLNDVFYCP